MILYYQERNGDFLAIDTPRNRYHRTLFGNDYYEGRATGIASLVSSVCTTSISREFLRKECKIMGQKSVVAQVAVALEAAFADNKKFDSALMVGSPGVGKSALAHVIADEIAAQLHEVLGQSIDSPANLNSLLLTAKDRDVIHIDEAHELDKTYQTSLYLAMDPKASTRERFCGPSSCI